MRAPVLVISGKAAVEHKSSTLISDLLETLYIHTYLSGMIHLSMLQKNSLCFPKKIAEYFIWRINNITIRSMKLQFHEVYQNQL